jgi:hypothetical protein
VFTEQSLQILGATAGHGYLFAELAYPVHQSGFNAFVILSTAVVL